MVVHAGRSMQQPQLANSFTFISSIFLSHDSFTDCCSYFGSATPLENYNISCCTSKKKKRKSTYNFRSIECEATVAMVVPPSPRISNYFSRPFQDFVGTATPTKHSNNSHAAGKSQHSANRFTMRLNDKVGHDFKTESQSALRARQQQAQILRAVLRNDADTVEAILQQQTQQISKNQKSGSNIKFAIGRCSERSDVTMDGVFAMKRLLGESPTALHVATLNVYFRCTGGGGKHTLLPRLQLPFQRRNEEDKARKIARLLVQQTNNSVNDVSPILISGCSLRDADSTSSLGVSPLGLVKRIQQLATKINCIRIEATMQILLEDMKMDRPETARSTVGESRDDDSLSAGTHISQTDTGVPDRMPYIDTDDAIRKHDLDRICQLLFGGVVGGKTDRKEDSTTESISCAEGLVLFCLENE
jgi:hypothetical protein